MVELCHNHYLIEILNGCAQTPRMCCFQKEKVLVIFMKLIDLEYPEELHDLHNDYPCAAEKIKVTDDMLSDYCNEIKNKFKINSGNVHKLIPTLRDKKKLRSS